MEYNLASENVKNIVFCKNIISTNFMVPHNKIDLCIPECKYEICYLGYYISQLNMKNVFSSFILTPYIS